MRAFAAALPALVWLRTVNKPECRCHDGSRIVAPDLVAGGGLGVKLRDEGDKGRRRQRTDVGSQGARSATFILAAAPDQRENAVSQFRIVRIEVLFLRASTQNLGRLLQERQR